MIRTFAGVVAGFIAWAILWVSSEKILKVISPDWFGAHQRAFQAAIEDGSPFMPDSTILLIHVVLATIVSLTSGYFAAVMAGENKRAPLILGFLLLAAGLLKAVMSWPLVPLWYHIIFTALLLPLTILGGKLKRTAQ
jgi:hypothetical protein